MDTVSQAPLKVLMFPWLAYGHISPFFGLAKNLADRGFTIYLCSTPVNLQSIKNRITQEYAQSIHLVEFPLESTPDFPPQFHTTNGLPIHLQPTLRKAVHKAKPNLSTILANLDPNLVIYDIHQSWIAGLTCRLNIPAVKFLTSGAGMLAYFLHLGQKPGVPFPFPEIYVSDFEQARAIATLQAAKKDVDEEAEEEDLEITIRSCDNILLLKSSREIEGKYIDYVSDLMGWKISPFCSLLNGSFSKEDEDHELISWLGTKQEGSSVFVSFGSEFFLNETELEEIAFGLELSGVNFIWVLRFPKESDDSVENSLPEGFTDRIGDKGKVVKGWAPQARILSHPSIGGFVSHCGWNSVVEAIEIGTPIIAVPMHLDQPFNARLVVGLGAGVEVKRDGDGKLKREEIAAGIKDVVEGKAGEEARRKVRLLGQKLKAEENEGLDALAELLKTVSNMKVVSPGMMPKLGKAGSLQSRRAIVHSLVNTESWAIDLSWDIIARFGKQEGMPKDFFTDFVKVAQDEGRHFTLLAARLEELGSFYGALPAHDGLWDSAMATSKDLLARLAIEHCVHEARGLDVLPTTIARFRNGGDDQTADLLEKVIYPEEITHCAAGVKWFRYLCFKSKSVNRDETGVPINGDKAAEEINEVIRKFHDIVREYFRGPLKPPFNEAARKAAGFGPEWYEPLAIKEAPLE